MTRSIQMFRRVTLPLVVALVAFGLFAPTASAANTAVIAGTVRAQQTGDPLPGATVSVYLTPNVTTPVATTTTAIDGSYQVATLAAGTYKVRFSADATTFVQSWYWFAETAADATAISMAEGDQVNWVDGYLSDATTSVAGTVYEPDGATAVQGVIVDLFSTGDLVHPVYTTPTEADGTYLFEGVTPGDYLARFTPDTDQRSVRWYWHADNAADAQRITIEEGNHLTSIDGYLVDATASIGGTLRYNATGLPVGGATVDLFNSSNTITPLRTTTSAADGQYSFEGLAAGIYKVRFAMASFKTQWYYVADSPANASELTLGSGVHQNSIDGWLQDATMSIGGTVRYNATSRPAPGAAVDLFSSANTATPLSSTTAAADGTYLFEGLTAGAYKVRYSLTDYKTTWYYSADTPVSATEVVVAPGGHPSADSYLQDATMSVSGTVYDGGNSNGIGGITIDLFTTANTTTPVASATTSADGSFSIPVPTAGAYLARATGPSTYFPAPQWYQFAIAPESAQELNVSPGAHIGASFYLTPSATWTSTPPSITGTAAVGSTLTAVPGTWTPAATTVGYQWYINDAAVTGATSSTWMVAPAAAGRTVRVAVTGSRADRPSESRIASVTISAGTFAPAVPTISGTARVGATLTASPGSWTPMPDYFTYEWRTDGSWASAEGPTFIVPPNAVGKAITVAVTGHRTNYGDVARTSAATAAVLSGNLTAPAPTITGTAAVGLTLSANPGTWAPATTQLGYQWKAAGTAIAAETGATLTVPASALGKTITVSVTGTADGYTSTTTTSVATAAVALGTLDAVTPTITGTAAVGATLTAHPGAWRPYPVLMTYQWNVDGVAFPGATKQTFAVPASASGKTITVTATGNVTGYAPASRTSSATTAVTGGTLAGPTPTITGTAQVGQTLTANPGTWGPAPVTLAYQWFANGTAISGATSGTLVVPGTALSQPITVRVTASKSGFTSVNKTSAPTSAVTAGQILPGTPTISGSAQVGQVLTANTGSWSPNPDAFAYQWKAAGTNITNAIDATLTIPADALGKTITVVVTGAKTGYTTVSRESSATATVVAATGTLSTAVPTISGTSAVGELLTANAGTWGPAPVDLTYQWKSAGANISGATSSVLEIPATSLGQTITVTVTGTKTGYTTASQTSIATAAVAAGTLFGPTPMISGSAVVGSMLTANPGAWGPSPVALTYQWKSNGSNITGATTANLTIPAASLGQTITVVVTGTKTAYTTASKESAATATVANPIGTLTTSVPTISGTARVDSTLTADAGAWGPAPVDLTYQWKSNGTAISGATATTLVVPAASLGQTITVTVTGTKTGYTTASQTSAPTTAVAAGVLTSSTPTITGTAQVGNTLSANAGTWGPIPVTLTYQWKAGGTAISGATGSTFLLTPAQAGTTITVEVTGTKTGYTTATKESASTATVTTPIGTLTTSVPTISGTAQVDSTLTANAGVWGPAPVDLTYQWKSNGTAISGATAATLVVPTASLGQTITVTVTGSKTGYTTASQTSIATAAVAAGTLTAPTPTVTGSAVVGSTLTAASGTWGPAPVTLAYQWKAAGTAISGETGSTLTIPADAMGKTITVTITGTKTGYTTASKDSAPTAAVTPAATGSISGLVVETDSTPASGIDICLFHQEGDISTRNFQDVGEPAANGTYSFTQVPAGRYVLLFITSGSLLCNSGQLQTAPYWPQWYRWGNAAVDATPVLLTAAAPDVSLQTVYMTAGNGGTDAELFAYAKPTISGTAAVGQTLTAAAGSWFPAPTTVTRQWNADGVAIPGATGGTFVVTTAQQGKKITVTETASGTDLHTTSASSDPTATVPVSTLTGPTPTITGTAKVGSTLTAKPGVWAPAPVNLGYAWKAAGVPISGATGANLVVPAAALGKTITVTVTGSKAGYTSVPRTSAATSAVVAGTLTGPTPTIAGTAKVGSTLTARPGTWAPAPVTLKYQWKINGANISGATASTYKISASYVGKKITVTVTGSKTAYTTLVRTSASTSAVVAGTLTAPTPTISGTAKVGYTLTARPGTWGPAPVTLSYQWKANGAAISGATASTYKVAAAIKGKKITVTVTGRKTGYVTTAKTSVSTATVAAGTLTAQTPSISGRAKVGVRLTANPGTWSPSPVTLTYRWKANGASISGATAKTFVIPTSAKGKKITVTVTGTKTGYTTVAKTSSPTATVS